MNQISYLEVKSIDFGKFEIGKAYHHLFVTDKAILNLQRAKYWKLKLV